MIQSFPTHDLFINRIIPPEITQDGIKLQTKTFGEFESSHGICRNGLLS
jgi:hypothetical protein